MRRGNLAGRQAFLRQARRGRIGAMPKPWSEIRKQGKLTDAQRAEVRRPAGHSSGLGANGLLRDDDGARQDGLGWLRSGVPFRPTCRR